VVRFARVTPHHLINGIIVSNVAFLGALLLLGGIARGAGLSDDDASRAIWYLALFPTSYFCFLPLPESLFMLLSFGAVYAAQRQRWWAMGLLGGLAALTRLNGALLVIPLTILAWRKARAQVAWVALVPAGTLLYMAWLYRITGNAWAFRDIQPLWYRQPGAFWRPLLNYLHAPALVSDPWNFIFLNFVVALAVLAAAVVLLVRRDWAFGLYTLASILLPLSAGNLQSVGRYALVLFPLFLLLALAGRRPSIDRTLIAAGSILLGWLVALYALRVDMALA
jgi:Gpi18-like mannosyltransferase